MKGMMEDFLKTSGVSAVSLLSYRRDLERLFSHFENAPEKADEKALSDYFTQLGDVLSPTSLTRHISVVRSFYKYLLERSLVKTNPVSGLHATSFCQKKGESLTKEEFDRLISCPVPGFRGMRDRAMLMLLCDVGLRVSELVELNREDFTDGVICCGLGKRRRCLPLSRGVSRALGTYCCVAELYPVSEDKRPLFITAKGTRLTRQGFWKNLKDRAIYSGVDKPLSPQTLRTSLALHLMEEGRDREEIRMLLGNADTASLRGYEFRKRDF